MNSQEICLDSIIKKGEGNIVSDMDGEIVILSIKNGKYYNLGGVGSFIWELIESPTTMKSLISNLIKSYNVNEKECASEVMNFLKSLANEGIVQFQEKVIS